MSEPTGPETPSSILHCLLWPPFGTLGDEEKGLATCRQRTSHGRLCLWHPPSPPTSAESQQVQQVQLKLSTLNGQATQARLMKQVEVTEYGFQEGAFAGATWAIVALHFLCLGPESRPKSLAVPALSVR